MSIIYLAKLKDFINKDQYKEKKYNYLVLKGHEYKFKKLLRKHKPVSVDLFTNYDPSDKYLLSFKIEEFHSAAFKAHVDSKFKEFTKGTYNINKESISEFFKFLEADGLYDFEACSPNEELIEPSAPMNFLETPNKKVITSSHNLLDEERGFSPRSRSNSLSEEKTDTESVRKANLLSKLSVENSSIASIASSTSSLESLENEAQKSYSDRLAEEIQSVFFNENQTLLNINKHRFDLQKGYFNGQEKYIHLSTIFEKAEKINLDNRDLLNNSSSSVNIETLQHDISELQKYIKEKKITDVLSRYRGFSPLRCFATLWGGGRVKSIEYIEQLQDQLDTLTKNISGIRPAA